MSIPAIIGNKSIGATKIDVLIPDMVQLINTKTSLGASGDLRKVIGVMTPEFAWSFIKNVAATKKWVIFESVLNIDTAKLADLIRKLNIVLPTSTEERDVIASIVLSKLLGFNNGSAVYSSKLETDVKFFESLISMANMTTSSPSVSKPTTVISSDVSEGKKDYAARNTERVSKMITQLAEGGLRQDYKPIQDYDNIKRYVCGSINIKESLEFCMTMELSTPGIISGMAGISSAISAAVANEDAVWAVAAHAVLRSGDKVTFNAMVKELSKTPEAITHYNRCGYILSTIVALKDGAWLKCPQINPGQSSTMYSLFSKTSGLSGLAQTIASKKVKEQAAWAVSNPAEYERVLKTLTGMSCQDATREHEAIFSGRS